MSKLFVTGFLAVFLVACGGTIYLPEPDPGTLDISENPLSVGQPVDGSFPPDGRFVGFVFDATRAEVLTIELMRTTGSDVPSIAIYPAVGNEWGEGLAWASANAERISIEGWEVPATNRYLVLIDVVSGDRSGTFAVTLFCTGNCPGSCPEGCACASDADCDPGLICENGACAVETCDTAGAQRCQGETVQVCANGTWLDAESCADSGQYCFDGTCVVAPPCAPDGSCPPGLTCDAATYTCIADQPGCQSDTECPGGTVCIDGVCVSQGDCIDGEVRCSADLVELQVCQGGAWTVIMMCQPPFEVCDVASMSCRPGQACSSDGSCPPGMVCDPTGMCVPGSSGCQSDADCPAPEVCVGGQCQPSGNNGVGDLCLDQTDCNSGLTCLLVGTVPGGYCTSGCDCQTTEGCPGSSMCVWSDGTDCWCGFLCPSGSAAECPDGGAGWECQDWYGVLACIPQQTGACIDGEMRCTASLDGIELCQGGAWFMTYVCDNQSYCQEDTASGTFTCQYGGSCNSNDHCPSGMWCDLTYGVCRPGGGDDCQGDADCPQVGFAPLRCEAGQCVAPGFFCDSATQCPHPLTCSAPSPSGGSQCALEGCSSSTACPAGLACDPAIGFCM